MLPRAQSVVLCVAIAATSVGAVPAVAWPAAAVSAVTASAETEAVAPQIESEQLDLEPLAATESPGTTEAPVGGQPATEAVSAPQQRDEFGIVGVSIPSDEVVDGLRVEVRTRQDQGWTAWEALDLEFDEGPDAGTIEAANAGDYVVSEPLIALDSDAVQVKLTAESGESLPADVTTTTINPGTADSDTAVLGYTTTAAAGGLPALPMPAVVTRAGWGADESRRRLNQGCGDPSYASSLKAATLHHTAGANDYSPEQAASIVRGIYAFHTAPSPSGRGWCDIGYNALVDKWGRVFEGRYGGLERAVVGAHAGGFNSGTFGISMMGTYSSTPAPQAVVNSISRMIAWKFSLSGVDPNGSVTLTSAGSTRYASGTRVTLPTVFGHRDVSLTDCPGNNGYAQLPAIRDLGTRVLTNAVLVQAWYSDFLGRPADNGAATWRQLLDDRNPDSNVLALFLTNREYLSREVNRSYLSAFGRESDSAGLDGWVRAVQSGQFTLENVAELLYQSQEFYQRSGGTDPSYAKGVYQAVLGRTATDSEANAWAADIGRFGRGVVVNRIWRSVEAGQRRITANYQLLLGRAPDSGGLEGWTAYELILGDAAVRTAIATSTEYRIRAAQRF